MQQIYRTRPPEGSQASFLIVEILLTGFFAVGIGFNWLGQEVIGTLISGWAGASLLLSIYHNVVFNHQWNLAATPVIIDEPQPEIVTQTTYNQRTTTPNGQTITYSNIVLLDSDWLKVARYVLKHGSISRDAMCKLNLQTPGITPKELKTSTNNGPTGYERFIQRVTVGSGAGWFKQEKGSNVLTEEGRVHFTEILYPPTPSDMSGDAFAHETTDGDEGNDE